MNEPAHDDSAGRGLAAAIAAAGYEPPVLVIAETTAVARLAVAWMHSFDEAGWLYRVRSFGGEATSHEIEAIAAEARSLGATTIAAIGDEAVIAACEAAASRVGIPSIARPWSGG
ncbi:MAG: hypothetical protein ACKOEX_06550 [Planctomycetia bacterium]